MHQNNKINRVSDNFWINKLRGIQNRVIRPAKTRCVVQPRSLKDYRTNNNKIFVNLSALLPLNPVSTVLRVWHPLQGKEGCGWKKQYFVEFSVFVLSVAIKN